MNILVGAAVQGGSCLGGNCPKGGNFGGCVIVWGNHLGGSCQGVIVWEAVVQGVIVRGYCQGGNLQGEVVHGAFVWGGIVLDPLSIQQQMKI